MTSDEYRAQLEESYGLKSVPLDPDKPDGLILRPWGIAERRSYFQWVEQRGDLTDNSDALEESNARMFVMSVATPDGKLLYSESDIPTVRRFNPDFLDATNSRIIDLNGLRVEGKGSTPS